MILELDFDAAVVRRYMLGVFGSAMLRAADMGLQRAQGYCPIKTGELMESGVIVPDEGMERVWIVFPTPYAPFIEFGHYTPGQKSWVPPQPFLRPAMADVAEVFPQLVSQVWADPVAKGDGSHYYASSFAYSRGEFENQYTTLGFPTPGPSE